jgi:hypothetical protein
MEGSIDRIEGTRSNYKPQNVLGLFVYEAHSFNGARPQQSTPIGLRSDRIDWLPFHLPLDYCFILLSSDRFRAVNTVPCLDISLSQVSGMICARIVSRSRILAMAIMTADETRSWLSLFRSRDVQK